MLSEALDSVFEQECGDYEVIVVDDGSTDDLTDVVKRRESAVTFIRQENAGPGAARNRGAAAATGEYLAFLDSDDLWFPWTLKTFKAALNQAKSPAMVVGSGKWFRESSELKGISQSPSRLRTFPDFFSSARNAYWVGSGGLVVRRRDFEAIGGFCTKLRVAEDLDLLLRLGTRDGFILIESPSTFAYRQHAENSLHDVAGSLRGAFYLIEQETSGAYPGKLQRAVERRRLLTRFLRPPSFAALRNGHPREAWTIYKAIFSWHMRIGRFRYLLGFPLLLLANLIRKYSLALWQPDREKREVFR